MEHMKYISKLCDNQYLHLHLHLSIVHVQHRQKHKATLQVLPKDDKTQNPAINSSILFAIVTNKYIQQPPKLNRYSQHAGSNLKNNLKA